MSITLLPTILIKINVRKLTLSGGKKKCTPVHVISAVTLAFVDAGFSAADREASLELIKLDISRTFPNLCIFQQVSNVNFCLDFSEKLSLHNLACTLVETAHSIQIWSRHLERKKFLKISENYK